jgi:hypothetical protein
MCSIFVSLKDLKISFLFYNITSYREIKIKIKINIDAVKKHLFFLIEYVENHIENTRKSSEY